METTGIKAKDGTIKYSKDEFGRLITRCPCGVKSSFTHLGVLVGSNDCLSCKYCVANSKFLEQIICTHDD